jgi:hypothetical protein
MLQISDKTFTTPSCGGQEDTEKYFVGTDASPYEELNANYQSR